MAAKEAVTQARSRVEQIMAAGASTDVEEALLVQLADLKALVSGTVEGARDVESLRTVIRQLFARVEVITLDARLGFLNPSPYGLLPILRPEMIDLETMQPIKQPLPDGDVTLPTCR